MPQCRQSSRRGRGGAVALLMAAWLLPELAAQENPAPGQGSDSRLRYSGDAPPWLRAVGQLRVPGSRYQDGRREHFLEDCSATLVARSPGRRADTIITAWHCLEYYNDLSRPITFTLSHGDRAPLEQEAYRLAMGGSMQADWAILRLRQAIETETATALAIHPGSADPARAVIMAGYSRDAGAADRNTRLSYDPRCLITAQAATLTDSNCLARKGASGGAVIQLSDSGVPLFSGVVSQGDSAGLSQFVPVDAFRGALNRHLP